LAISKIRREAEGLLNVLGDVGKRFDGGKLVDGLRVVGDRTVAIDGDGDRSHAQEAKGHAGRRRILRGQHQGHQEHGAHEVADAHEGEIAKPNQRRWKLPATKPERMLSERTAFPRAGDDFANVVRIGWEVEGTFTTRDRPRRQRAATDDRGELPPHGVVAAEAGGDHEHAD